MTPAEAIASLDRQIADHGEDVLLRRFGPLVDDERSEVDTPLRAFVRPVGTEDMIGDITAAASKIVLSPTDCGGLLPIVDSDMVVVGGRALEIRVMPPVRLAGTVVRVNLVAKG